MKTKTTYLTLLLAAGCMMAGFTACTEEPEPDPFVNDTGGGTGGIGGGNIGGGNDDNDDEEELTFRVTSFTYADEYGLPDDSQLTRLQYDTTGRFAGGNFHDGEWRFYIQFDNSGKPQLTNRFNPTGTTHFTLENFQLNAQGYVTSVEWSGESSEGIYTGRYDTEGHLLEWTEATYQGNELTNDLVQEYTWSGDDLVEMSITYISSTGNDNETFEFAYNTAQGNPSRGVPWFSDLWESYEMTILRYAGLLGKMSRNIPTSITYLGVPNGTANLQTGYNIDGSLSWIRLTGEGGENTIFFGYNNNPPGQY